MVFVHLRFYCRSDGAGARAFSGCVLGLNSPQPEGILPADAEEPFKQQAIELWREGLKHGDHPAFPALKELIDKGDMIIKPSKGVISTSLEIMQLANGLGALTKGAHPFDIITEDEIREHIADHPANDEWPDEIC